MMDLRSEPRGIWIPLMLAVAACAIPPWILALTIAKGWPALTWEFFTSRSRDFGSSGGVVFQIAGTLWLMLCALVICFPVALGSALFQSEVLRSSALRRGFRVLMLSLNGVPTIVFGLMGYLFFAEYLRIGVSWLTGALILAVMVLPTLQVAIQDTFDALPESYRETGRALGLSSWQVVREIILPQCAQGIVTGVLLGLARAGGETAAIMFTATVFSGIDLPASVRDPVVTLQTHILALAQEAVDPVAVAHAWGSALVLLMIVLGLIATAMVLRVRWGREVHS